MAETEQPRDVSPASVKNHSQESFFARSLRYWRKHRGLSQMALALEAEVSTRHLSFLETDRSRPGREVVERLLDVLKLGPLDRSAMFAAAGFPLETEGEAELNHEGGDVDGDEPRGAIRVMFEHMLERQEPYPGFVLNAYGDVPMLNGGARRLFALLNPGREFPAGPWNLFELYFAPEGFTRWMDDPQRVGRIVFAQVRQELLALNSDRARRMLARLTELAPYLKDPATEVDPGEAVFETVIRAGGHVLRLQSAMAILGTPAASSARAWRFETIFPVDEATRRFFEY